MMGAVWKRILLDDEEGEDISHAATNTQSIAEVTGIARETVRRKLSHMHAKGWVRRDAEGNWIPTRQAASDLRPATLATIAYLRTVFAAAFEDGERGADG
jgi:DNA-binding IclR family transcriptional regulator